VWRVAREDPSVPDRLTALADPEGMVTPPALDVEGYLEAVARCRHRFPEQRIWSGVEMGEPHRHPGQCARILAAGRFDRVLGSLHTLPDQGTFAEPPGLYQHRDAHEVMREYLAEVATMMTGDGFSVLAHIDYPVRSWPVEQAGPFTATAFEDEFRHTLRVIAQSGRALEINTRVPLPTTILAWWHEEGGDAITFGSDAHRPEDVARRFADAAQIAEAHGFRPGRKPHDLWGRIG
jgi:histidinol-phosphatase (PHP family)